MSVKNWLDRVGHREQEYKIIDNVYCEDKGITSCANISAGNINVSTATIGTATIATDNITNATITTLDTTTIEADNVSVIGNIEATAYKGYTYNDAEVGEVGFKNPLWLSSTAFAEIFALRNLSSANPSIGANGLTLAGGVDDGEAEATGGTAVWDFGKDGNTNFMAFKMKPAENTSAFHIAMGNDVYGSATKGVWFEWDTDNTSGWALKTYDNASNTTSYASDTTISDGTYRWFIIESDKAGSVAGYIEDDMKNYLNGSATAVVANVSMGLTTDALKMEIFYRARAAVAGTVYVERIMYSAN